MLFKKELSCFLIVLMFVSFCIVDVSAQNTAIEYVINSAEYSTISSGVEGKLPVNGMNLQSYAKYELSIGNAGIYGLKVSCAAVEEATLKLYVDGEAYGEVYYTTAVSATGYNGFADYTFTAFPLSAGNHTLCLQVGDTGGYVRLQTLTLSLVSERTEIAIDSNNYSAISVGVEEGKPLMGIRLSNYAEYTLSSLAEGTYALKVSCAAVTETPLKLYVDDKDYGTVAIYANGWGNFVDYTFPALHLSEGEHTIRLMVGSTGEYVRLKMLTLSPAITSDVLKIASENYSYVSKGVEEGVPAYGMNLQSYVKYDLPTENAGIYVLKVSCAAVDPSGQYEPSALKLYVDGEAYGTDYYEITIPSNGWSDVNDYTFPAFALGKGAHTLCLQVGDKGGYVRLIELTLSCVMESLQLEPTFIVKQNGTAVAGIPTGDFSVQVFDTVGATGTVIAVLYDESTGRLCDIGMTSLMPRASATINGLTGTGSEALRVFYWESKDSLVPISATYTYLYLSPQGDDTAAGTVDAPLKSITEAMSRVRQINTQIGGHVVVNMAEGTYPVTETISFSAADAGQNNGSVTYRSIDSEAPAILSGGTRIDGTWELYQDGIYKIQTTGIADIRQLYINDYPAQRAKTDFVFYASNRWDNPDTEYEEDGFIVVNKDFPILAKPKDAEIVYNILWTHQRLPVKNVTQTADNFCIEMDQPYYLAAITMKSAGPVQPIIGQQFYVENDLDLLDSPGEFYFDKDTGVLYYYPFAQEDINSIECVAAQTQQLISVDGGSLETKLKNLHFEDLSFRYGAEFETGTYGVVSFQAESLIRPDEINSSNHDRSLMAQLSVTNAENVTFKNCDISCMGGTALRYGDGVYNSKVTDCLFRDNGGSALSIGSFAHTASSLPEQVAKNILLENNVITRPGLEFMFAPAVCVYYSNSVQIRNNDIFDTPYTGISLGWGWGKTQAYATNTTGHVIEGNRIERVSHKVRDGGHIYTLGWLGDTAAGTRIANNFLSESADYGGIYFDTGTDGVTVTGNVVETSTYWLFDETDAVNLTVQNNYTDGSPVRFSGNSETEWNYEAPTEFINSNWSAEALAVIEESGSDGKWLAVAEEPQWRSGILFNMPKTEYVAQDDILVEAEDYDSFSVKNSKTEPAIYKQGTRYVVGDIRQFEWLEYKVEVPEAGEYIFEIRYSVGPDYDTTVYVDVSLNNEVVLSEVTLDALGTTWGCNTPKQLGSLSLNEGENTIRVTNGYDGFSFDSFKLIKIN